MKLGILVTTDRHGADVLGLARAAVSKGHEVIIFNMDDGVRLLADHIFTELCRVDGVTMAYCDLSSKQAGVLKDGIPQEVICGSQYNNAVMMHNADKVIRL